MTINFSGLSNAESTFTSFGLYIFLSFAFYIFTFLHFYIFTSFKSLHLYIFTSFAFLNFCIFHFSLLSFFLWYYQRIFDLWSRTRVHVLLQFCKLSPLLEIFQYWNLCKKRRYIVIEEQKGTKVWEPATFLYDGYFVFVLYRHFYWTHKAHQGGQGPKSKVFCLFLTYKLQLIV